MSTLERLSRLLTQRYKLDPARLTPDQRLDELGIDSLGMVEMLFFIEEEFGVQLPSEGVALGSLGAAATYIDELMATQKAVSRPAAAQTAHPQPASTDPGA